MSVERRHLEFDVTEEYIVNAESGFEKKLENMSKRADGWHSWVNGRNMQGKNSGDVETRICVKGKKKKKELWHILKK